MTLPARVSARATTEASLKPELRPQLSADKPTAKIARDLRTHPGKLGRKAEGSRSRASGCPRRAAEPKPFCRMKWVVKMERDYQKNGGGLLGKRKIVAVRVHRQIHLRPARGAAVGYYAADPACGARQTRNCAVGRLEQPWSGSTRAATASSRSSPSCSRTLPPAARDAAMHPSGRRALQGQAPFQLARTCTEDQGSLLKPK